VASAPDACGYGRPMERADVDGERAEVEERDDEDLGPDAP
jgi:hypothetical protein